MDLRPYSLSEAQINEARRLLGYQPFIVSDTVRSGAAYQWMYPESVAAAQHLGDWTSPWVVDKNRVPATDWDLFCDATARQRAMYEDWIDAACRFLPDLSGLTMADVACNSGYFPVAFSLRGARDAHGFDMINHGGAFDLLNGVTGSRAVFHHVAYDSTSHVVPGMEEYDIVFATAIVEHLSDPLQFLHFISSRCGKLLLLFVPTLETKDLAITFNELKSVHFPDAPFPVCFDSVRLSVPLIYRSLELCGFNRIVEMHRRDTWVPPSFYRNRRVFMALR